MSIKQGSASYPPIVKQAKILGYVAETNGIFHSRDIGRGFSLSGNVYLMFGDTFCNDSNGEFMGLVNNTVAIMEDFKQPLRSKYVEYGDNGLVKPFLPLTPEEVALEMDGKGTYISESFFPFPGPDPEPPDVWRDSDPSFLF